MVRDMPGESGRIRSRSPPRKAAPFDLRLHFGFERREPDLRIGPTALDLPSSLSLGEFRNGRFHAW
jgi:hypothetical protein